MIPRNEGEMYDWQKDLAVNKSEKVIEKAHKKNKQIEEAVRIVRMFQTEEFKMFWDAAFSEMKNAIESHPKDITGNPFEKLEKLGIIQGGFQMLDSQEAMKMHFEAVSKLPPIDVVKMEEAIKNINA